MGTLPPANSTDAPRRCTNAGFSRGKSGAGRAQREKEALLQDRTPSFWGMDLQGFYPADDSLVPIRKFQTDS